MKTNDKKHTTLDTTPSKASDESVVEGIDNRFGAPIPRILVSSLRPSEAAREELTWFFERALSEIEIPSNYPQLITRLAYRRPLRADTYQFDTGAERRAGALHAARIIYERLRSLEDFTRWVIRTLYDPRVRPEQLEAECGWLTPLVCTLPSVEEAFEEARARGGTSAETTAEWLAERVAWGGLAAIHLEYAEAQGAAARAHEAYERTRAGFPESVVPGKEVV